MLSLDEIRLAFAETPGSGARVVSRATLPVDVDASDENGKTPLVFVPDLHLLSHERSEGYGDYFNLNNSRENVLIAVLQRLITLRDATASPFANLRVLQLGDFHDLWRESEHWWWDEDIRSMVARQLESHETLFELFRQLKTERLVGNHDKRLRSEKGKLAAEPINEYFPVEMIYPYAKSFRWGSLHRIDMIHADIFDKVETGFFSFLNPVGARLAEHNGTINIGGIDEWEHELEPPGTPDSASDSQGIEPAFVYDGDPTRTRYYANCQKYFRSGNCDPSLESLTPVATIIGHTHFPRIVIDAPSPSYGLVDCGSWVNQSFAVGTKAGFWNGQLGVLTGNEIGILQVG